MGIYLNYFRLQLQRMRLLVLPLFCASVLLFCLLCALLSGLYLRYLSPVREKLTIGIVGNVADSPIGVGMNLLEQMDDSRFSLQFRFLEREEAREMLGKGRIQGYLEIPEDFLTELQHGVNRPLRYVTESSVAPLSSELMRETAEMAVQLLSESERGVYAMQDIYLTLSLSDLEKDTREINLNYITAVMHRGDVVRAELTERFHSLSPVPYYLLCAVLLLLLFSGTALSVLFPGREELRHRYLAMRGLSSPGQLLSEWLASVILFFLLILALSAMLLLLLFGGRVTAAFGASGKFPFAELSGLPAFSFFRLAALELRLLPVLFLICALHFFCHECFSGSVAAILLDFLLSLSLSYLSGLFYPSSFFPKEWRTLLKLQPVGAAKQYLTELFYFEQSSPFILFLWTAVFLLLCIVIRERRIRG